MHDRAQVRDIIKAMKRGLELVPGSTQTWSPSFPTKQFCVPCLLTHCCPLAHAAIGVGRPACDYNYVSRSWPIMHDQRVLWDYDSVGRYRKITLALAIETLSGDLQWTTEQVIEWLSQYA